MGRYYIQETEKIRMAFLNDKITDIGLPAEITLFTVPPNQVAVEKKLFGMQTRQLLRFRGCSHRNFGTRTGKRVHRFKTQSALCEM